MRLEDLPESGNVEDRRDEGGGGFGGFGRGGGFGHAHGRGRLVDRHRGRARPCRLGARHRSEPLDRRRGNSLPAATSRASERPSRQRQTGAPKDESGRFVSRVLGSTEATWKDIFSKDGKTYRAPTLVMYRGVDRGALRQRLRPRWGRSIVPTIRRSISTLRSSTRSRRVSAAAAAIPAGSRRLM